MNLVCSLVCFLALIANSPSQAAPPQSLTGDDYAIYSKILEDRFVRPGVEHLIIGDHTMMKFPRIMAGMTDFGDSPEVKKLRRAIAKDTQADYDAKNKTPAALESKFSISIPVVLLSAVERDEIFGVTGEGDKKTADRKGFETLDRLYPNSQGFMRLSRVGYNHARTQALVSAGNVCGPLCGEGRVFLLVKDGNSWKIKYAVTTWVS